MTKFVAKFSKNESGATAIEYGLIAALIAVVLVTAMGLVGGGLETSFGGIATTLENNTPAG
jgi:pilus assembly protein Flp/PilA